MLDFMGIYSKRLNKNHKKYRKENPKTDSKYRASSSGMCNRKVYFEAIDKAVPTNEADDKSTRIMRLGTVIHDELQTAIMEEFEDKE